jgi:murein endopeptidase
MKGKRHTSQQIVRKLREAERLKAEGDTVGRICQQPEVSEQTCHRWKNEYGRMAKIRPGG